MDTWLGKECAPITLNKYVYANADPVWYTDPSGNISIGGLMSAINVRATLSTSAHASYRVTLKRIGKKLACVSIEEVVLPLVVENAMGGIYVLLDGNSNYVGRTNSFERRYQEHTRNVMRNITRTLARFHIEADPRDIRAFEQLFIDLFRENQRGASNTINSVAQNPTSSNSRRLRALIDRLDFCD